MHFCLIDGKQRCSTLDDYLNDGFAISKNVKNYNIRYQVTKLDENGNEVLNEDGFTEVEFREFDIRNKKFSQLPDELQEIFEDRQIPVLYNMNCTKKDIADDIARFNRSRPMNVAQNGWLGLDEDFAELVENICKMPFFQKEIGKQLYDEGVQQRNQINSKFMPTLTIITAELSGVIWLIFELIKIIPECVDIRRLCIFSFVFITVLLLAAGIIFFILCFTQYKFSYISPKKIKKFIEKNKKRLDEYTEEEVLNNIIRNVSSSYINTAIKNDIQTTKHSEHLNRCYICIIFTLVCMAIDFILIVSI